MHKACNMIWIMSDKLDLKQSKCSHLQITRNINPIPSSYRVMDNKVAVQKVLVVLVTSTLKWNAHVTWVSSKASTTPCFFRRSCHGISTPHVCRSLYVNWVIPPKFGHQKHLAQISHIRRDYYNLFATDQLLAQVSWSGILVEAIQKLNSDSHYFSIKQLSLVTRYTALSTELILNISKSNILTYQNSYYC